MRAAARDLRGRGQRPAETRLTAAARGELHAVRRNRIPSLGHADRPSGLGQLRAEGLEALRAEPRGRARDRQCRLHPRRPGSGSGRRPPPDLPPARRTTWPTPLSRMDSSWSASCSTVGRARRERLFRDPPQFLGLRCRVGEGEQQLPGCADGQRQRLSDLGEVAELVAAFDGRYADAAVTLPNVQMHALPDRVAEPHHGRLRDSNDVACAAGGLPPASQARTRAVVRRANPEQQPQLDQLRQQPMDRGAGLTQALRDGGQCRCVRRLRHHVQDQRRLLENRHQSTGRPVELAEQLLLGRPILGDRAAHPGGVHVVLEVDVLRRDVAAPRPAAEARGHRHPVVERARVRLRLRLANHDPAHRRRLGPGARYGRRRTSRCRTSGPCRRPRRPPATMRSASSKPEYRNIERTTPSFSELKGLCRPISVCSTMKNRRSAVISNPARSARPAPRSRSCRPCDVRRASQRWRAQLLGLVRRWSGGRPPRRGMSRRAS